MSSGRRRRDRRKERSGVIARLPWRNVVNRLPPIEVLSADQVEAIHQASLQVLATEGMRVLDSATRDLLSRAGAEVDETEMNVRFDPAFIEEQIAHAPATFTLKARNPD